VFKKILGKVKFYDETLKARAAQWFDSLPHIIETEEFIFF